jgi:hypothetical protein
MAIRKSISKDEFIQLMKVWNDKTMTDIQKADKLREILHKWKCEFGLEVIRAPGV